jgi:hypothetical protein
LNTPISLFCRHTFAKPTTEKVRVATGDAVLGRHGLQTIDFLMIDVEGAEFKVLRGFLESFTRRQIGLCQVEYGATYIDAGILLRDVFAFAAQVGYGAAKLHPRRLRLLEQYDPTIESFKYANYVLYRDANLLPRNFY